MIMDFAEMAGVEYLVINQETHIPQFKDALRWNEMYYHFGK
jgi:L-arabinose isomerase